MSPLVNAPNTVLGIRFNRKSAMLCCSAAFAYEAISLASSAAASTFMPSPGPTTLTIASPTISAIVLTTSKYSSASTPVLPIAFMFSMPATPVTTVQKMIGAIIILMSLIKPSPNGFIFAPNSGAKCPKAIPMLTAIRTWK